MSKKVETVEVRLGYGSKAKRELVKVELYVPRATFGNYEKLRQALKYDDVKTTIQRVMEQKIRQVLGSHFVAIPKDTYAILEAEARKKHMEINELATQIILGKVEAK